jgi:hypothetical protein
MNIGPVGIVVEAVPKPSSWHLDFLPWSPSFICAAAAFAGH